MAIDITTPISDEVVSSLEVGDTVTISGYILCGRDAVLPKIVKLIEEGLVFRRNGANTLPGLISLSSTNSA